MSRTAAHTWQLPSPDFNGVCSTSGPSRSTGGTNSDVEQVAAGQRGTGCFNGRQMVSLHILSLKQKDTTLDVTGNPTRWRAFWLGSERQTKAFVTSSFLSLLVWHLLLLAMHLLLLAMRGVETLRSGSLLFTRALRRSMGRSSKRPEPPKSSI